MKGEFRLPVWLLDAMWAPLSLHAMNPPDFTIGGPGDPYLQRWHLTARGAGPAVYLHRFLRSDDDRALHDHPYESVSILLHGAYLEHMPGQDGPVLRQRGDVVTRTAEAAHRVELLEGPDGAPQRVWTLFLTGPRIRDWGFHCPQGWVPWEQFTDARDAGAIGRGCD